MKSWTNEWPAVDAGTAVPFAIGNQWPGTTEAERSMKWISAAILLFAFMGCDRPSSKEARIQQVRQEVVRGGGEARILDESRILFAAALE